MIGYTVSYVGFWAIPLTIIIAALKKDTRMSLKDIIECLMKSGKRLLSIGATCCGISMIMGVCNLTGITQTLSTVILNAAGGSFLITLILIAMICIVLGMGMPTVSVYMLLSTVAAPALINGFGIPVLAAHMYVFYFGLMANVTPPVALPAYAAAGLAGSNPNKTGWQALKLALGGFIVPFVFIYSPDILFIGAGFTTAIKVVTALFGILILSTAIEGWMYNRMSAWQRIAAVAAGICFISTGHITDVAGILLVTVIVIYQRKEKMLRSSSALLS
ncbi:TRAP transporter large permease subunit [Clostridium sp. AM58-1XD]|uniref:TRAP transporter large permease subunit n=1 Tax=Clostridium sp. AM58-1XD TaxID=2292307 RepID=UPI0015F63D9B|nr:TRAP transporter large permease subunit [Clostridium sp. AM58-1XD]